jgi:amino acid transporter
MRVHLTGVALLAAIVAALLAAPAFALPALWAYQEGTLVANLGRPGAYRYAGVAAHSTVKKGIFTIRKT